MEMSTPAAANKKEATLYVRTALLYPSKKVLESRDPELLELLQKHSAQPKKHTAIFKEHMKKHWHFNTTLMDADWYNDMKKENFDVGFNPFETMKHFPYDEVSTKPQNPERLFDHLSPFFADAAKSIKQLEGRLMVEAVLGDYADVAEQIQFGLYSDHSGGSTGGARPKEFPTVYDRIHLSNVPFVAISLVSFFFLNADHPLVII